jgi:hypothetical protein
VVRFPYSVSTGSDAGLVRVVAHAAEGNRNHALHWAACRAHERGSDPALLTTLVDAAIHAGLSEAEARRTVQSASRTVGVSVPHNARWPRE